MNVVNIGSNDGADHVFEFCISNKNNIRHIHLIEPIYAQLKLCMEKYKDFPNASFYNKAITGNDEDFVILYCPENNQASAHSSLSKNHLFAHGHSKIHELKVSSQSLCEFLDKNVENKEIYLYIDTEGKDCQILLTLDFDKFDIKRVEFEFIHSDGPFTVGNNYFMLVNKLLNNNFKKVIASQYNEAYQR